MRPITFTSRPSAGEQFVEPGELEEHARPDAIALRRDDVTRDREHHLARQIGVGERLADPGRAVQRGARQLQPRRLRVAGLAHAVAAGSGESLRAIEKQRAHVGAARERLGKRLRAIFGAGAVHVAVTRHHRVGAGDRRANAIVEHGLRAGLKCGRHAAKLVAFEIECEVMVGLDAQGGIGPAGHECEHGIEDDGPVDGRGQQRGRHASPQALASAHPHAIAERDGHKAPFVLGSGVPQQVLREQMR